MKILYSHTSPQFEKDYVNLSAKIQSKAKRKIQLFEENCFHRSLDTHKLKGVLGHLWSFCIDDNYRVVFRSAGQGSNILQNWAS